MERLGGNTSQALSQSSGSGMGRVPELIPTPAASPSPAPRAPGSKASSPQGFICPSAGHKEFRFHFLQLQLLQAPSSCCSSPSSLTGTQGDLHSVLACAHTVSLSQDLRRQAEPQGPLDLPAPQNTRTLCSIGIGIYKQLQKVSK